MWLVSDRFLDALTGSHEAVTRMRLIDRNDVPQFGVDPPGIEVPVLDGDVVMSLTADIKRTLAVTVPGTWWDQVQPYGQELFVERGIDFGDGTTEWVPLGYFRIQAVDQPDAPDGPIDIEAQDRTARLIENRAIFPAQIPDGATHREVFEGLVNGGLYNVYKAYLNRPAVPIVWTTYDPDDFTVDGGQVVEDSSYDVLAALANNRESVLRFRATGILEVGPRYGQIAGERVITVKGGPGGTLLRGSRSTTREGVYNNVAATSSDPAVYVLPAQATLDDPDSPLYWLGPFGVVVRYFASPLLRTEAAVQAAAQTVQSRYVGLPLAVSLDVVPNPATEPGDPFLLELGSASGLYQVEKITLPLAGSGPMRIVTRTLNEVA